MVIKPRPVLVANLVHNDGGLVGRLIRASMSSATAEYARQGRWPLQGWFATFRLYLSPPAPRTQRNISSPLPKREPELELELESQWASQMQLVTFRATATKIADEYLEDREVTIHNRSARGTVIRDRNAYSQGDKDSKKIDVHTFEWNHVPAVLCALETGVLPEYSH